MDKPVRPKTSNIGEAWLFVCLLLFVWSLRPSPYFVTRRLLQFAVSIGASAICSFSVGAAIWWRHGHHGRGEGSATTFANSIRLSSLPCMPALMCAVLVFFWDGPPINFTDTLHMIGGIDWRVWLAYTLYASTRRPDEELERLDLDISKYSWVYVLVPTIVYWQVNAFFASLCWDFVIADILPRLVVTLRLLQWKHWRGKLLLTSALIALLRLNIHHCDHRIVLDLPSVSTESYLKRVTLAGSCSEASECDETSCLPEDKSSWWHTSSQECWSPGLCFQGVKVHGIKHGQGSLGQLYQNSVLSATWRNGFVQDATVVMPGQTKHPSNWLCGHCISGHCPPSSVKQPSRPKTKRKSKLLLQKWTEEDVTEWLCNLNMTSYTEAFARHKISGKELLQPQLYDEEYLMTLGVQPGDSVRLVSAILTLISTHHKHQKELQALLRTMDTNACTISGDCYFFGNVYPQVRHSLLLSLGMPAKSWLLESVWHMMDMLERMDWESHAAHTLIQGRSQPDPKLMLLNQWSQHFHNAWPSGLLDEDQVLAALGVYGGVLHCFMQHFDGHTWNTDNLNRFFLLLMDLDGNLAVDFTEYILFLQSHTHFYQLVRRSPHQQLLQQMWPQNNALVKEQILFHALRLSREHAVLGDKACTCQKLPAHVDYQLDKLWLDTVQRKKDRSIYYGYDDMLTNW